VGSYFNLHNVQNPDDGYPITSFSYILVYRELDVRPGMTMDKAKALTWFLWWAIHDGQHYASGLSYVPLPETVVTHDEATLRMITFNGQQVNDWV
jgi:ABC-type phosphate transport system substrate-binding protein